MKSTIGISQSAGGFLMYFFFGCWLRAIEEVQHPYLNYETLQTNALIQNF